MCLLKKSQHLFLFQPVNKFKNLPDGSLEFNSGRNFFRICLHHLTRNDRGKAGHFITQLLHEFFKTEFPRITGQVRKKIIRLFRIGYKNKVSYWNIAAEVKYFCSPRLQLVMQEQ